MVSPSARRHAAERAGLGMCAFAGDAPHRFNRQGGLRQNLPIPGNQHPDVADGAQRPRQRGGDFAQTAGLDIVADL